MEKIKVEREWGHFEDVSLIKAYKGHYEAEFTFKGERFYLVEDYNEKENDLRVYSESEFLLADEPKAIYRVNGKESGRLPLLMYGVIFEAMKFGRNKAESGIVHLSTGR